MSDIVRRDTHREGGGEVDLRGVGCSGGICQVLSRKKERGGEEWGEGDGRMRMWDDTVLWGFG